MTKIPILFLTLICLASCEADKLFLEVSNTSKIDRVEQILEIEIENPQKYAVFDEEGNERPSQVTYDGKLIFPATVAASSSTKYYLKEGVRKAIDTIAYGRIYPEWYNNLSWENDKIGFRAYSKDIDKTGAKLYGYDIFTKKGERPVLNDLYARQFQPDRQKVLAAFKASGDKAALQRFIDSTSYHIDHGKGMDYYAVGATLGSGASALVLDGEIQHPSHYSKCRILDRGGLRFTFELEFEPQNGIIEKRIISLDAGTYFNRIKVEYLNLEKPTDVAIGIVLHDNAKERLIAEGAMAYAEPTHAKGWQTYNAVIFPEAMKAQVKLFDEEQRKQRSNASGYLLSEGVYTLDAPLVYYMGAAWNEWGFTSPEGWFTHVENYKKQLDSPLEYSFVK